MQVPVEISFRNCEPSEQIRAEIQREAERLDKIYDRITACTIVVTAPDLLRHRKGALFKIGIRIALPRHRDVVVDKTHSDVHQHEHISIAIKDAFSAARRQVRDAVREMHGDVKQDIAAERGRISKLVAGENYGFIETADGREIYFHSDSVLNTAFRRLRVGAEVSFAEEEGDMGPQASTVHFAA